MKEYLLLMLAFLAVVKYSDTLDSHFCPKSSEVVTSSVVTTYISCGSWGRDRCPRYQIVYSLTTVVDETYCCANFTGENCDIPVCSPVCQSPSACVVGDDGNICNCTKGTQGEACELAKCYEEYCNNRGDCGVIDNELTCNCSVGYAGERCETAKCYGDFCKNSGVCEVIDNELTCNCLVGYAGERCETVECHGDHCYNGGVCAVEDDALTCYCHDTGYEGDRCQTKECPDGFCNNGGTCDNSEQSLTCNCAESFTGDRCEIAKSACNSNPCDDGYTCTVQDDGYVCQCTVTACNKSSEDTSAKGSHQSTETLLILVLSIISAWIRRMFAL